MAEPMTTEGTLERLRWLVATLPPLPWTTGGDGRYGRRVIRDWDGEYTDIAEVDGYTRSGEQAVATAEAIAAVFNALPALLDVAEAARELLDAQARLERLEALREAVTADDIQRPIQARHHLRLALAALDGKGASGG